MADSQDTGSSAASSPSSSPAPVQARRSALELIAELSDSDSDVGRTKSPSTRKTAQRPEPVVNEEDDNSEDEIVLGGGRLAARLAGKNSHIQNLESSRQLQPASPVQKVLDGNHEVNLYPKATSESADEEFDFRPKRSLLLKRKRRSDDEGRSVSQNPSRRASREQTPAESQATSSSIQPLQRSSPSSDRMVLENVAGKSKFELLIEKARKERLAREEAEKAEKAEKAARVVQQPTSSPRRRGQRGSSPADDSEEDSDRSENASAQKLTRAAQPTRKASKKALEEMHRETQRMNRSMHLAHQATTKKKYDKQSFFNSINVSTATSASSTASSETENNQAHETPPTSPLREPETPKGSNATGLIRLADHEEDEAVEDIPDFLALLTERSDGAQQKVQQRALSPPGAQRVMRVTLPEAPIGSDDIDSGSDLDIISDKASSRKITVFENLPARKAKELPSHLVLRALAHVRRQKDEKSLMYAADMGPNLQRAARQQAQEERKAKLDKLRAAGVVIQTAEEKEHEEEELEDLVERARREDEDIRKREKELAKKEGTYVKDNLDDEDSDDEDDGDFDVDDDGAHSGSDEENDEVDDDNEVTEDEVDIEEQARNDLVEELAEEESQSENESDVESENDSAAPMVNTLFHSRMSRQSRLVVNDDEDDEELAAASAPEALQSPILPPVTETPRSIVRSARKLIPGLQHSDDLPMGLTQAFAATMADSQTQAESSTQEQDSMDILRDLPSPHIAIVPRFNRLNSVDMVSESVPSSQIQPMDLDLGFYQSQLVPESPQARLQQSQTPFDLTQDAGYTISPFTGDRFADTPGKHPHSTEETVILRQDNDSPIAQRRGRLRRGRQDSLSSEAAEEIPARTAFQEMSRAAKRRIQDEFNKKQSEARQAVDEAAEESDDEYAGLGGASDDESGEENEEDRRMIDEDTQIGRGDEAKLAKLHAERERQSDEAGVSKLLKDLTTGGLRRKRGAADDLDLSDEEDATTRRLEAKRREFAKMQRELLKDEALRKIADDQKKQAFMRSIEDQEDDDQDDIDFDKPDTQPEDESQPISQNAITNQEILAVKLSEGGSTQASQQKKDLQLNATEYNHRRARAAVSRKPGTFAEIREQVSFLIEESESQPGIVDLGLSDSEDEPEMYVNLSRHLEQAEADEDAMEDGNEDLGDFIVDDATDDGGTNGTIFKKPELPSKDVGRANFSARRTKATEVVDRLSLKRQSSSSTGSNASVRMAFTSGKATQGALSNVPSLLRRATTNSSIGSISGRDKISATGVVTSKTERGSAAREKDFVRKGANTSRNAINYQGRQNLKDEKMSARAGVAKKQQQQKKKKGSGFLEGLLRSETWD